jgi:hypothetical protein
MGEEFEFRDLSDSQFWGVDLQRTTFRDVDLSGSRMSHSRLVDVEIDAQIDRLVVNGVDVTTYVNERDEWFTLRAHLLRSDMSSLREGWPKYVSAWTDAIGRARRLPDEQRHASVDGEWSFVQTIRHLVFATDKWFTAPVLGGAFDPIGLPNSGSKDFGWPGLDQASQPSFDDVVEVWQDRAASVGNYLDGVEAGALDTTVDVLENGPHAVHDCIGVVFEEHFQHLRYALRDLDRLDRAG